MTLASGAVRRLYGYLYQKKYYIKTVVTVGRVENWISIAKLRPLRVLQALPLPKPVPYSACQSGNPVLTP